MRKPECKRLQDVDAQLKELKRSYENVLPIYTVIDRTRLRLETDIKILERERLKLVQGQLIFEFEDIGF